METAGSFYGDWLGLTVICTSVLRTNKRRRHTHSKVKDTHIHTGYNDYVNSLSSLLKQSTKIKEAEIKIICSHIFAKHNWRERELRTHLETASMAQKTRMVLQMLSFPFRITPGKSGCTVEQCNSDPLV